MFVTEQLQALGEQNSCAFRGNGENRRTMFSVAVKKSRAETFSVTAQGEQNGEVFYLVFGHEGSYLAMNSSVFFRTCFEIELALLMGPF